MQNFASTIRNGSTLPKALFIFLFFAAQLLIPSGVGRAGSPSNLRPLVIPTSMPEPDVDDISYDRNADQVKGSAAIPDVIPDPTPAPEPDIDGDDDGDGIPNSVECAETLGILAIDMDGDGLKNCDDLDSDGDGLSDWSENQRSGVIASQASGPVNSDGDAFPDYLDTDSDNDGISDTIEAFDLNGDNIPDVIASGIDADNNGMDDTYEAAGVRRSDQDNDGDGFVVWLDVDEQPIPSETTDITEPTATDEPPLYQYSFYLPIILQ